MTIPFAPASVVPEDQLTKRLELVRKRLELNNPKIDSYHQGCGGKLQLCAGDYRCRKCGVKISEIGEVA